MSILVFPISSEIKHRDLSTLSAFINIKETEV